MPAGRKPLPANVHLLRGNPSKKSEAELVGHIRVPIESPTIPVHLGTAARVEWKRIVPHLITAGLVTQLDRAALAAYCQAWGEWQLLEQLVKDALKAGTNPLIDNTPSGYKQVSALAQVRDRARDAMLRCADKFGCNPANRISSTTGQQMALLGFSDDPMEGFLQAGAGVDG